MYVQHIDKVTQTETAVRCVLNGCFWDNDKANIMKQTGVETKFNAEIFIKNDKSITGREYVSPEEWAKLSIAETADKWTVTSSPLTVVVNDEMPHEFTPTAVGNKTVDRLAMQIEIYRKENPLTRLTVLAVDPQLFGASRMQHINVRC